MKNLARNRIQYIGIPKSRNDDWLYFPTSVLSKIELPKADGENEVDTLNISKETDFAALLPLAYAAKTKTQTVKTSEQEFGILKTRDEFAHAVFCVENNAELSLEICKNAQDRPFSSERIDIFLGESSKLNLFMHEDYSALTTHLLHINIVEKANAYSRIDLLHTGKGLTRTSINIALNGEYAESDVRSLSVLNGNSSSHTHLRMHHNEKATKSSQLARNILSDSAYVSYDGKVDVMQNCTDVKSSQLINTILQNEGAKVSVKPTLRIYHDAVECTHGNTCGSLDNEELFYLESRGFESDTAKRLLSRSFARETFSKELSEESSKSPFAKRLVEELYKIGL